MNDDFICEIYKENENMFFASRELSNYLKRDDVMEI